MELEKEELNREDIFSSNYSNSLQQDFIDFLREKNYQEAFSTLGKIPVRENEGYLVRMQGYSLLARKMKEDISKLTEILLQN